MATKIRRCLYIGLGGTGMKSLLYTKKMFIDTYGEVPPMIGFLGIDTDGGEYKKGVKSANGRDVTLDANEQVQLKVRGPVDFYIECKEDFTWIPESTVNAVAMLKGEGAGGVRSNGRFAFTINKNSVKTAIANAIANITNASIVDNNRYELLSNNLPEIHMVFSVCGGTGCGSFINMAYLLKEVDSNLKVSGYAVLPGVFKNLPACAHVMPNTYGALVDLDYLMHHGIKEAPIALKYLNGSSYLVTERPFSNVMFIDNTNAAHDNYNKTEDLSALISLALVTAAGELSVAGASVGDNFAVITSMGTLDIVDKKAWAGGIGACEIIYRGDTLAEIYQAKAAQILINKLTTTDDDANVIANAWIDSAEVKIRENNGRDDVIDYLATRDAQWSLSINDMDNPTPEVDNCIQVNRINPDDITKKTEQLLTRTNTKLQELIAKHLNGEGGVALAKNVLDEVESQIDICLKEMQTEKEEMTTSLPLNKSKIDSLIAEVKRLDGIFQKSKRRAAVEDLCNEVKRYCSLARDIQRHDGAIVFYNSLKTTLSEVKKSIATISELLVKVNTQLTNQVNILQASAANDNNIFQINLAEDDAKRIKVNKDNVIVSEFVKSLGDIKLSDFEKFNANQIEEKMINYTKTMPTTEAYRNKGVEDVLKEIQKQDDGEEIIKNIILRAYKKSMPLFKYDHHGRAPKQDMIETIYVGVADQADSIFKQNDLFKELLPNPEGSVTRGVDFATTGMKDKIVIYQQFGVVPIYALDSIDNYKRAYDDSYNHPTAHHFDDEMRRRMESEEFTIKPESKYKPNDTIDLWIKGFIYGLIKNEKGRYFIKSKALGNSLDGYWVDTRKAYRNEAYEIFKQNEAALMNEFRDYFTQVNNDKGAAAIAELIADVKVNYYDNYSQINLPLDVLRGRGYEGVRDLMSKELDHVETL